MDVSQQQHQQQTKRVRAEDPVDARVELVLGEFELPAETKIAINAVCHAADAYARALTTVAKIDGVKIDKGRLIAALDAVLHSKEIACAALKLPHATREGSQ
jgi:hypothetical protein